jgi:demethylmenaquinone methyltransferase/2-methoxy-6-polyprenyl-1,4-benzoquinol methylase
MAAPSATGSAPAPVADAAWTDPLLTNPHAVADKRSRVQKMFAAIAPSYDLNNRLHSFWRDQAWRRKAVKLAELKPTDVVVDVACGTGDLTLAFAKGLERVHANSGGRGRPLNGDGVESAPRVIGVDFTFQMLPIAATKSAVGDRQSAIYLNGDAQALPLPDACCDVVSIAFGVRNVQDIPQALREFRRVLRPGGRVIVLEFSEPRNRVLRTLNRFYCGQVMPRTATWISGDRSGAYKYLPKSIETFIDREKMASLMADAGFGRITQHPMTFGVCVCYRGVVAG